MTSTNDGKDVKSNQTSGHKSKSYYIELYTSLEKALSGGGSLEERTAHVCEAWRRVYSLYQHSATSTHPHLLSWLQRHTANTVLQSKWAKSKNEQVRLTKAIDALVAEATAAATGREQYPWEKLLLQRAAWFRKAVENPWDNPVLKSLINPDSEPITDQQVLEWLISEHGIVLVTRLQHMVCAGNCDDLALLLASAVMDRARAAIPHRADDRADDRVEEEDPSSFMSVLEREASFTSDDWEMLTDIELVLLLKTDKRPRCIELAKLTPLRNGYKMVERLRKRLEMHPRDKKLWKHAKDVAKLVAQVVIARCMVLGSCMGAGRDALYWCARALARLVAGGDLRADGTALAAPAATARHLHTFTTALSTECKELKTDVVMKPFICELYVRAITAGMNELEQLKLNAEKESEARLYEQTLAGWFTQLGTRLTDSARLRAECALTAFSVHPARKLYERVANTPPPPKLPQAQEPTPETTSEYGSWANDSRTQSNLVKTSETLQLKQSQQHQANVLSTAILTEGEALGLEPELCQDLAVLLSGPRVKTLSWDMDREVLLENCRSYMDKTHGGTRAVTTELKFLNLDPDAYRHLPEEGDDENDLFYGIEKGYEHEVQFEEPENIWQNAFFDPEQTESANDSEVERHAKKKTKPSSEDDEDPLSNIAEAKREKKKLAKEKSKERRKKSDTRDDSKDGSRERRKDTDKKTKKERKKDKSEQPTTGSLTSLLGMKVTKMTAQVQDGEKRVRKKKERRREPKTMFSYVSVTDSDYDSQGKSSQVSEHDPNVLVDGVFSMDELRSPERTADSQKAIENTNIIKGNATVRSPVINDIKTRPLSSPRVSTASDDSDVSRARSPYLTPKHLGPRHVVSSKVKSSITKLLQFRKKRYQVRDVPRPPPPTTPSHSLVGMKIYQPEEVPKVCLNKTQIKQLGGIAKEVSDLFNEPSSSAVNYRLPETDKLQNQNVYNTQKYPQQYGPHHMQNVYNESLKNCKFTQHSPVRPAQQNILSQSPNSVIHTNYSSPIKTQEHMRTQALNVTPPKPTMTYQPFHKSMQNLSTDTKDPPKKPQLINDPNYFTLQHVKSNSSQLSPRIISNTIIKPPSQTPNVQQYSASVKDTTKSSPTYSNLHGMYTPRAKTNSQMPQSKNEVIRHGQKQLSISMQNISEPGRYDVTKSHIPTPNTLQGQATQSSVSSHSHASTSQVLYNSSETASRCLPIQHRERVDKAPQKPSLNDDFEEYLKELMSTIRNGQDKNRPIALNKDVKVTPVAPASAKRVDSVTPQCAKQLIQQKKTENAPNTFSRRSYMHKNKQSERKVNLTDSVTLEINRAILDHKLTKAKCINNQVTISRVSPNTQNQNVVRKLEQPSSRLQKDCPVLSSMLDSTGTAKIQTVGNTSQNTSGNLANREDADLLLLLRNQSILKPNVSTIETLPSDVNSGQTSTNPKIKEEVPSAHLDLVGTKVKNINILETSPVKSESEENKSLDWKCVMDAIMAQKTEPLGPNALDLVLNKDYRRQSQSSRSYSRDKHRVSGQTAHNKPSDPTKRSYSSKASSSRKKSTEKHSDATKTPGQLEIKNTQSIPKGVSQTTVIQNSDYDALDELMDDDLRREIGELFSDEDADSSPNAALLKGKTQINIPKSGTNVYKAANITNEKPHIVPKTIPKNETNTNIVDYNRRFAVSCPTTGYPNVINNNSSLVKPTTNPEIIRQHTATSTIITKPTTNPEIMRQHPATTIITKPMTNPERMRQHTATSTIITKPTTNPEIMRQHPATTTITKPMTNPARMRQHTATSTIITKPTTNPEIMRQHPATTTITKPMTNPERMRQHTATSTIITKPTTNPEIMRQHTAISTIITKPATNPEIMRQHTATSTIITKPETNPEIMRQHTATSTIITKPAINPEIMRQHTATSTITTKPARNPEIMRQHTATSTIITKPTTNPEIMRQHTATSTIITKPTTNPEIMRQHTATSTIITKPTTHPEIMRQHTATSIIITKPATNPEMMRQHIATSTIITSQVAQDTANNIITSHIEANHFASNVIPANVIIASVPQPPPQVVVIRQDLVYDPYPTIRIHDSQGNAELCTINQSMYALNAPNIAVFQTTQYAAPVINPVIIGNALTTTNVSNAAAMESDHTTPDCMKDKQEQDSISLEEAIRLTDDTNDKRDMSSKNLEDVIRLSEDRSQKPEISTNLDLNMNRNCERKVLSQVQEKHPNDMDKDLHLKKSPVVSPLKTDEDRIKLKRETLMNRKISHAAYHPPIPLTYTPLTKKVNLEKQLQQETSKNGIVKSMPNSASDIEKCVVTSDKSPQSEMNNENIESTDLAIDQVSSAKENQKTCRRIWLRSSNKIINKLSSVKRPRVPLRRNKIKLNASEVTEKATIVESANKDGVKNPTRVSNRILNKVKLITPATNETPTQETQQNVAENNDLVDFEAALCGSIVLKTPASELATANKSKQEPEYQNIVAEKKLRKAEFSTELTHINSTEDTKMTSQSSILESKVVIEKLNSTLGDQFTIKSSSNATPVKEAKVVVIKNKNRTVLRKRIPKCISLKGSTANRTIIKTAKNTASPAIVSSVANKSNKLKPVVILDQKVIKAPPMGSPLVSVETNKIVEQISAAADDKNKSKPAALDNEILADQNVTKQTTTVSTQPVINENNEVKSKVVSDKTMIKLASSRLDIEKGNKILKSTVDNDERIKQSAGIVLSPDETNKSTTVYDTKQTSAEDRPVDVDESNKTKSKGDQRGIKQTESTSDSSTTVQKRHGNESPDCNEVSSEIEVESQTLTTPPPLYSEKTYPTKEIAPSTVMKKQANTIKSNRSVIMLNSENPSKINAGDTKLKEPDSKPNQKQSLISDNVNVNHLPVTQKNSENIIDISDKVQSTTKIQESNSKDVITNKEQQIYADKSLLCKENIDNVVKGDADSKSDIIQDKQDVLQILNPKQTNPAKPLNAKSKPDTPTDKLKRNDDAPSKEKQTYITGGIKIEELPVVDSTDTKLIRITLPNGKVFRATIHGRIVGDFDSLLADPRMRSILSGSLNDGKRYTVNYKQVCKADKSNPSKILATQIQDLNIRPCAAPIDTVNLISDDEDEVPSLPSRSFTTEFGKYTTNVDEETFTLHQNRFNQKCEVKMRKGNFFKSNKTKPKRNLPSERSSLLTRNKSKLLVNASVPVEVSTTTNLIPEVVPKTEIATEAQETHIPTLEQTNTLKEDTANIIEIDDSSNDCMENATPTFDAITMEPINKLIELKGLLLHDLGVGIDTNATFPLTKEKAVGNLKSALLQELGIATTEDSVIDITADDEKKDEISIDSQKQNEECHENNPVEIIKQNDGNKAKISTGIQKQKTVDSTVQNNVNDNKMFNTRQEEDSLPKCVLRLVRCDNLIKKYEHIKAMKKCYIKLERLNNSIFEATTPSSNENINMEAADKTEEMNNEKTDEMNQDNGEDFIEFDVEEPSSSPQLSRCPSFSILNNWDDDSQPLGIPCRSSPVMEIYDTIVELRSKLKTELLKDTEKKLSLSCDSEWTVTKFGYRVQEMTLRSDIPTLENNIVPDISENNIVPDCDNLMVSGVEKLVLTFNVPKLLTITLNFFEDNPDVIYRLESLRSLQRILTTKTSNNKLKRKTEEVITDSVASKILKLGTLALNSLNSCIKVLDGIRFLNNEEIMTVQPDTSSINIENHIIESPPKVDTTMDNTEGITQIDDFMCTSDIENSEPEESQTDLVAECERNNDQTIQDLFVNEDINSPLEETMLICPVVNERLISHIREETNSSEGTVTITDSNTNPTDDDTEKCKEYSQDGNQCDDNKEYSSSIINVTHVHEETNSSEGTITIADSNAIPTDDDTEKAKEYSQDGNQCDANNKEYSSPAIIGVAHVHEETMTITDSNTSPTYNNTEKFKEESQDGNQCDDNKEYSSSIINVTHVHEETNSSEGTITVADSTAIPTDDDTEKCKEYSQDGNQCEADNKQYSSPTINVAHIHEETNSSDGTMMITHSNTSPTDDDTDKCKEYSQDGNQCDANNKEYSSPTINKAAHVHEETMTITDSNTSPTDDDTEKCKEESQDGNQCDDNKEYLSSIINVTNVEEETNSSEGTMTITDSNTIPTTPNNKDHHNKEYSSLSIKVAHVHEETNSSEETVPITDSETSPTDAKAEKCQEESQDGNSKPENCKTDLNELCEIDDENCKACLTPAISAPLVNEDTSLFLEGSTQMADTDISPTDNGTKEEKITQSGDDIAKEQSETTHMEVDLVTDECEQIKIDENTNTPVNDNSEFSTSQLIEAETSISCVPNETNTHEDNHEVQPPSLLSIEGDMLTTTCVNVSNEGTTNENLYLVLDEIPIEEIHQDVYEVEVADTHVDDGLETIETLHEKSHGPITISNEDPSEIIQQDFAVKSPVFTDSKKITFNYHDYTKQPKKKDVTKSSTNSEEERNVKNDEVLLTKECTSETGFSCEETPKNLSEVNARENCPLKSNPECKYELSQEDDLLTVKITTLSNKDDNDTKTVFVSANDAEDESVASICSDNANDDIDIKGFEFEDIYVFPLNQSAGNSNNTSNDSVSQESNSEIVNYTVQDDLNDIDFHVIEPEITYSRKRTVGMWDIRVPAKKYRKGKNIDCSKQTAISMAELAYGKEYKRLLDYCSSVKFSYTRPFHKECVEVDDLMSNWPIKNVNSDVPGDVIEEHLFVDLQDISSYQPDPMTQTFFEEINYEYETTDATPANPSNEADEINFNMGFGEGSGRVIQILKKGESNISAATLSDVKQSQPVLKSVDQDCNDVTKSKDDQIKKIRQHVNFIELRDKVRTFFKKTSVELKSDWLQNRKDADFESKCNDRFSAEEFPFDLCSLDYMKPLPTNFIVQVVQVGQLPVSAAAQNPVTCDPRVTQVSDASPSQCSVDTSPNDDSQSEIKTEYTELTTADLTLPLQGYAQQNQANLASNDSNVEFTEQTISLEMEIKAEESPKIKEEMPDITEEKSDSSDADLHTLTNATPENINYSFQNNTAKPDASNTAYDSSEQNNSGIFSQQRQQNGTAEKTDQIAHAMNAAGITTTPETVTNTRAHALVNILSQKIRQSSVNTTQTTTNTYSKATSINAMALQQALAQILPPPLNQTGSSENNQSQSTPVGPQVLHIVQGKNASGNQITLVDNSQQSVINTPNATQVLHIVQNKNATPGQASNGTLTPQANSFSGLSLVDAGLQQGGNQLLHIVNTGNQKTASPGQLLKRVNLLTNLANVQGSNEQKMVQFVCKSADGKAIQLNAPHQRSMVLRLQPIETPNVQTPAAKPTESQEPSPSPTSSASSKESASQQEIKSRSIYEENYAKFIQNSSSKTPGLEKSTSLPKFNQAFGKPVFQDGQKQGEPANTNSHLPAVNTNNENDECSANDNAINLEHIGQISSPPLLLRKQPVVTSASQPNIVQQIKQTIAPMNIQTMHGGVIYTRQIPVNIGGGQTINLITVPSTELINDDSSKTQAQSNQGEMEPSIIKIVPQSQTATSTESSQEDSNNHASGLNENAQTPQPQPVLTQMRIKLPMLSKAPQMVPGARVVRPSFFQIQRNVIGGANQPVYQQLVLTAAPPLGQQTIRLPQAQASRPVSKVPSDSQSSSSESQMSTSTLEQLREFDMVLEQVKERSTVQPSTNSNSNSFKIHTTSSDTTDGNGSSNCSTESAPQVLYSIGNNQSLNVAYVNRKATVTTPTTSTYVRSPDSSGIADSPTSSTHVQIPHTVTTDSSPTEMSSQSKPAKIGSKSKSRPKSTSNPPNTLKLNSVPPKTSSQKPLEDEQTTQRILYILAEYKEQVENSPDKDKPAPRRRSNPPSNPGSSKRKKSSSSRRSGTRDMSPVHGEDTCRTMGSEDSSCGTSQGDCNESCLDSHSPQDSPRKVARKITFDQEITVTQPRPQPQRNVIVADGQTITVARGTTGKPATAVLMPANYILPVSMVKGGQQIAIVTNRGPKLLTVGGEGGATNALLLQRLIGPAGLKPVLARPGVRHVRLPTAALHNLQAFNLAATTVQPPDSTASPTPGPTPPELVDTRATSSPWTDRDEVKPERGSSPEGSEPWNLPSSADAHDYTYEETVRTDNMDRTVLDPIPDRYSPDMEAQRIFDKMFDVDSKKSYAVDSHDDSPRCAYDIDPSDCDDKAYQVVQKKEGSQRQHRLSHVSAAALRHKYAILEHELRLQKSLSEECEDLGVDSPSASELFPEAELLFAASPAHEHNQEHHSHTPQPLQSSIPQPDMDDQIATDHLIPREIDMSGLGDVGIVAVSEDGSATIALDQEEFARSHPNTTFHSEPTEGEVQPFTITGLKGRHITSTIFHSNTAPATVLMTAPQATVISQAPDHSVKYQIENMINSMPSSHNNDINLSSVLVKDDGLTRFDNILTDSRELHLTNTTSAIVHSSGNATQVIRRVCYEDDKRERDARYLIDEPDNLIAGDDAKMIAEDSSRDATLESMADVDDDRSSPERHAELFWESNSASERSESRRPLDFSSDSDKCCKSPFDETNSTDSSGVGTHMRLDSVIKEARGRERSGSADGSSADDAHPPLRTYPPKRLYHPLEGGVERSLSGKTRAGERSPDLEVRRRASGRGVVKRGCHCCNGSPAPPKKKPRQRKPTLDFNAAN